MWHGGILWEAETEQPSGKIYRFLAKVFDMPSTWGIDEGRISKLYISENGNDPELDPLYLYERCWGKSVAPRWMIDTLLGMYPGTIHD